MANWLQKPTCLRWQTGYLEKLQQPMRNTPLCQDASYCKTSPVFLLLRTLQPCGRRLLARELTHRRSIRLFPLTWSLTTQYRSTPSAQCSHLHTMSSANMSVIVSAMLYYVGGNRHSVISVLFPLAPVSSTRSTWSISPLLS